MLFISVDLSILVGHDFYDTDDPVACVKFMEYTIVVMPVMMTHFVMLQRDLIYTGITRAKKICVVIGTTKALA